MDRECAYHLYKRCGSPASIPSAHPYACDGPTAVEREQRFYNASGTVPPHHAQDNLVQAAVNIVGYYNSAPNLEETKNNNLCLMIKVNNFGPKLM